MRNMVVKILKIIKFTCHLNVDEHSIISSKQALSWIDYIDHCFEPVYTHQSFVKLHIIIT